VLGINGTENRVKATGVLQNNRYPAGLIDLRVYAGGQPVETSLAKPFAKGTSSENNFCDPGPPENVVVAKARPISG